MMVKPEVISSLSQEISFYRHHVECRVKVFVPNEESFPILMKYIDVSRTLHTLDGQVDGVPKAGR